MKKIMGFILILGWMGLGCCQSQCNGSRCTVLKQVPSQKVESKSSPQVNSQSNTNRDSGNPAYGQNRTQNPTPPSLIP